MTITNCQVSGYDEGTLLDGTRQRSARAYGHGGPTGRIKYGTESNGGFRNVTISNCVFDYCRGLALESVDGGFMEDITITNLVMRDIGNAPIFIRLGTRLRGPDGTKEQGDRVVPEDEKGYPEPSRFGVIPAWGLWARHVRNLALDRVEFRCARADRRPTMVLDDVSDARLDAMKLPHAEGAASIVLKNVDGFVLRGSVGLADTIRDKAADERF